MLLNDEKFYERLSEYGKAKDYEGAEAYLAETAKEIKYAVMPDPGCVMCGGGDVDEDGLTANTRRWLKERNEAFIIVTFEQGRFYQGMGRWDESIQKYEEVKEMMERLGITGQSLYTAVVEKIKEVKSSIS